MKATATDAKDPKTAEAPAAAAELVPRDVKLDDFIHYARALVGPYTRAEVIGAFMVALGVPRASALANVSTSVLRSILEAASTAFAVAINDILSAKRWKNTCGARQAVAYAYREVTGKSYPEIGRDLGYGDHTSAMGAVVAAGQKALADADYRARLGFVRDVARSAAAESVRQFEVSTKSFEHVLPPPRPAEKPAPRPAPFEQARRLREAREKAAKRKA